MLRARFSLLHTLLMAKRPCGPNKMVKMIVDIQTGGAENTTPEAKKNPPAKCAGCLAGGKVRAKNSRRSRGRV